MYGKSGGVGFCVLMEVQVKSIVRVLALAVMLTGLNLPTAAPAFADSYVNFGFSGPRFSFNYQKYPRYRYYGYGPRYYSPRYYYAPRYSRPYRSYRSGRSCSYWRDRCARSWGYGGKNYRGCLRYHRCR